MNALGNLKIGKKLGLGFGIVLLLTVTLGIVSLAQISKVNGSTVDIATNWLPSVQTLGKLAVDASAFRRYELAFLLSETKAPGRRNDGYEQYCFRWSKQMKNNTEPMISSGEERKI